MVEDLAAGLALRAQLAPGAMLVSDWLSSTVVSERTTRLSGLKVSELCVTLLKSASIETVTLAAPGPAMFSMTSRTLRR